MDESVEAATVCLAINIVIRHMAQRKRRKRKIWVRSWLASRETDGAFHKLLKDLVDEPSDYKNYLRMDLATFEELASGLEERLKKRDTPMRKPISSAEQLAVTLRFLATGESYTSLQYQFRISKSSLSLLIPKVCFAISEYLSSLITCPDTTEKWKKIANDFQVKWQLPNCLGAIDGKHVRILQPSGTGSNYYNYKGFFSVVLLAVVGANAEFIFADVGRQGRISDGGVLRNTQFYKALERDMLGIPPPKQLPLEDEFDDLKPAIPFYFVGDDAFSLTKTIMKPYPNRGQTEEKRIFNYRLSRARRVSENAFGILSSRFRVYHTTLNVKPESATSIVHATLVLHNYLLAKCPNEYVPTGSMDFQSEDGEIVDGSWRQEATGNMENLTIPGSNHPRNATEMRDCLSQYVNGIGQVPWQWKVLVP